MGKLLNVPPEVLLGVSSFFHLLGDLASLALVARACREPAREPLYRSLKLFLCFRDRFCPQVGHLVRTIATNKALSNHIRAIHVTVVGKGFGHAFCYSRQHSGYCDFGWLSDGHNTLSHLWNLPIRNSAWEKKVRTGSGLAVLDLLLTLAPHLKVIEIKHIEAVSVLSYLTTSYLFSAEEDNFDWHSIPGSLQLESIAFGSMPPYSILKLRSLRKIDFVLNNLSVAFNNSPVWSQDVSTLSDADLFPGITTVTVRVKVQGLVWFSTNDKIKSAEEFLRLFVKRCPMLKHLLIRITGIEYHDRHESSITTLSPILESTSLETLVIDTCDIKHNTDGSFKILDAMQPLSPLHKLLLLRRIVAPQQ